MARRLSAILAADVSGYSRLIGVDEESTLTGLRTLRTGVIEPLIQRYNGRIVKLLGDGILAEFPSVVDAVTAALEIQKESPKFSEAMPEDKRIAFRIGVNVGDVVVEEDGDIYGDGVNVAARLQEISPINGIAIAESAHRELRGKMEATFADGGLQKLKNIAEPVHIWLWPQVDGEETTVTGNSLVFDAFTIDLNAGMIRKAGEVVHVEPQVFDLITLLCSNPGRLISHDEIIEKVWNGRIVSDSAIATRINAARTALGDDGQRQEIIKTIRGRGFRLELTPVAGSRASLRTDTQASGVDKFVLSCTPQAYALLMTTGSDTTGSEHYKTLPVFLAEAATAHDGQADADNLAVFDRGEDALKCASTLIQTIENRCKSLPASERWAAKVGIGFGTRNHGFVHALAGRMDAIAEPGGICITKRALDFLDADFSKSVEVEALGEQLDDSSPQKITRITDWQPSPRKKVGPAQQANLDIPQSKDVSIIVLPFNVHGDNEELSEISIGLRLEIQNALVQLSGVLPMAAGTAGAFAGTPSSDTAEALGVRYVIQGVVRAIGRKFRLMLELYDHQINGVSWSQSYDGSLDDGFEFQDAMTARVVRAIDVKVLSGEQARIWHKSFSDLKAIRLQYRGMRDFFKMSKECMSTAREGFELLHTMHPEVSIGATWVALCNWFDLQRGWTDDREASAAAVEKWANIAIALPDADGQAQTALCHVHLLNRRYEEAEKIGEQAVAVRPSCANANGFYAHCLYYCGSLDKALHHIKLAMRFTPAYPPMFAAVLAGVNHAKGEHETAIAVAKEGLRINPDELHIGVVLCSALMEIDRQEEAHMVAANLLRTNPDFEIRTFIEGMPFRENSMAGQLLENCSKCFNELDQ